MKDAKEKNQAVRAMGLLLSLTKLQPQVMLKGSDKAIADFLQLLNDDSQIRELLLGSLFFCDAKQLKKELSSLYYRLYKKSIFNRLGKENASAIWDAFIWIWQSNFKLGPPSKKIIHNSSEYERHFPLAKATFLSLSDPETLKIIDGTGYCASSSIYDKENAPKELFLLFEEELLLTVPESKIEKKLKALGAEIVDKFKEVFCELVYQAIHSQKTNGEIDPKVLFLLDLWKDGNWFLKISSGNKAYFLTA